MRFTVLGSSGFIGRRMVVHLRAQGFEVDTPGRDISSLHGDNLGHVIYAIGMTGNFRTQTSETVDAHVYTLQKLLDGANFESWLYLSSTRLYDMAPVNTPASEDAVLPVRPGPDAIYNLSKLLGESICLGQANPAIRVARLANVYGMGMNHYNFLGSVIRDVVQSGRVTIGEAPPSAKDYVSVDDVVRVLQDVSLHGTERLYNVASGRSTTHRELAEIMRVHGYDVEFTANSQARVFPQIDITRISREFSGSFKSIIDDLPGLLDDAKNQLSEKPSKGP